MLPQEGSGPDPLVLDDAVAANETRLLVLLVLPFLLLLLRAGLEQLGLLLVSLPLLVGSRGVLGVGPAQARSGTLARSARRMKEEDGEILH